MHQKIKTHKKLHLWKKILCSHIVLETTFTRVSHLTNQTTTNTEPSTSNGWSLCSYSEQSLGEEYEVTCNDDYTYTKEFGIHSVDVIGLREVQIFGYGET